MTDLTKAEKLARALHSVISGSRGFDVALAAQCRDELRRLDAENIDLRSALAGASSDISDLIEVAQDDEAAVIVDVWLRLGRDVLKGEGHD